jgi:CDGSH-type Zn-finger protein
MQSFRATSEGMKRGYWRIVDEDNVTIRSGFRSATVARQVARELSHESTSLCRCGHPKHAGQCRAPDGCWCDTLTVGGVS